MRVKKLFNDNWKFHLGEVKKPFKNHSKTGTIGGCSNLTQEEGIHIEAPVLMKALIGADAGNKLLNILEKLEGDWKDVALPHDWEIRQEYITRENKELFSDEESSGFLPKGIAYYRKKFNLPQSDIGKRIIVEFEGVMRNSQVWVNGSYIGSHFSGYTGFEFDISEYLRYGDEGENIILVKTDTTMVEGWWSEGAGIYRDVWLYTLNPIHVKRNGIFVYSKRISKESATIIVETEIESKLQIDNVVIVRNTILSQGGDRIYTEEKELSIETLSENKIIHSFKVVEPILWELDNTYLYKVNTEIILNNSIIDNCETLFGIREIEYRKDGLYLNNELMEIKGVCEHQDFAGVGIALTRDIIDYKLKRIKDMGANAYRSAHHPATGYLLEACDREGIIVLNENRRLEVNPEGLADLEELIKGSRNHPCIFMWCLENEEIIAPTATGRRILNTLIAKAKKLDPTRQVTIAGQFAKTDEEYMCMPDVAGYNYDFDDAQKILEKYPNIKVLATESASFVSTRGVYEDDPSKGVCSSYDNGNYYLKLMKMSKPNVDLGTLGGALGTMDIGGQLEFSWTHFTNDMPALGGVFLWTAFDYRGETFPWYWPTINSQYGAMDMCGFEKDVFYYWQSVWCEEPMVHVLPHWSWPGKEGCKMLLEVYSNCEELELFINNHSQGRKPHIKGRITSWEACYEPGELKVLGYNDGYKVAEKIRVTAGEPSEVRLHIMYNGKEIVLIKAEIVDENGNLCPTADNYIQFSTTTGEIIGVGNGNPASHEPDVSDCRKAFNGLAMAIVKKELCNLSVMAKSDGLKRGTWELFKT